MRGDGDSRSIALQAVLTAILHRFHDLDPESQSVFAQALEDAARSLERQARDLSVLEDLAQMREALEVVEEIRIGMVRGAKHPIS